MIRITKNNILCVEPVENDKENTFDIMTTENGFVSYLDQFVIIDEGVTIGEFVKLLGLAEEEIDYIFDASLNCQSLGVYLAELDEPCTHDGALSFVEIVHDVELASDGILSEIKYFQGIGPSPVDGRLTNFSLELLPLNYYKDLPLLLNHNYVVQRTEIVNNVPMHFIELKARKGFTLYEVIYSVLYEISFHGAPAARKAILTDMLEMCQSISADALALPVAASVGKDAEIARIKEELNIAISEENYEKAAKLRDELSEIQRPEGDDRPR